MFRKILRLRPAAFRLSVFLLAALLAGCTNPANSGPETVQEGLVPNALEGSWFSAFAEEYKISETEFVSMMNGTVGYSGTITNIRSDDTSNTAGYITISYTANSNNSASIGKYYVIRWEDLENGTVSISGAGDGTGYESATEAEAGYTGTIGDSGGAFQFGSDCLRLVIQSQPNPIMGSWSSDNYDNYTITDKTISYTWGYYLGEIVNVRPLGDDTGYITFKYIITSNSNSDLVGYYGVLYWEKPNDDEAYICAAYTDGPGDEGKPTQAEAEEEYVLANDDYFYEITEEIVYEPPTW
jgi:hypothetical protein